MDGHFRLSLNCRGVTAEKGPTPGSPGPLMNLPPLSIALRSSPACHSVENRYCNKGPHHQHDDHDGGKPEQRRDHNPTSCYEHQEAPDLRFHKLRTSFRQLADPIDVCVAATGLWLFVAGLFFESETNIWYVVSGGWLIGLGGDRLWRDFVAPFLGFEEG